MYLLRLEHEVARVVIRIVGLSPNNQGMSSGDDSTTLLRRTFIATGNPFSASVHAANSEPRNVSLLCREPSTESTIVGGKTPLLAENAQYYSNLDKQYPPTS